MRLPRKTKRLIQSALHSRSFKPAALRRYRRWLVWLARDPLRHSFRRYTLSRMTQLQGFDQARRDMRRRAQLRTARR